MFNTDPQRDTDIKNYYGMKYNCNGLNVRRNVDSFLGFSFLKGNYENSYQQALIDVPAEKTRVETLHGITLL